MEDLYQYMKQKLKEMYDRKSGTVSIDCLEFMKLYKMVCDMKHIVDFAKQIDED